jgi:DNA polymerase-3 subunit epsilon
MTETLAAPPTFAAIDFETADNGRDSACAVAVVRVDGGEIVARWHRLIRPPRPRILFTYLHGIAWEHVADKPCFQDLWPELAGQLEGIRFLVAHNAGFDRSVLRHCCAAAGVAMTALPFRCTVQMAREAWDLHPTKLPDVCRFLNIPLQHHRAESDAEACAKIALAALRVERPARVVARPRRYPRFRR